MGLVIRRTLLFLSAVLLFLLPAAISSDTGPVPSDQWQKPVVLTDANSHHSEPGGHGSSHSDHGDHDDDDSHGGHHHPTLLRPYIVAPLSFSFLFALVFCSLVERLHVSWIPESLVIIAVGCIVGFIVRACLGEGPGLMLQDASEPMLNFIFLPLIIFESGWSLRTKDFVSQFVYILVFAVIGTFMAMVAVGAFIYWSGHLHGITDARTAFTFASLISATDPVATLATYSSLNVEPLLSIMVFGESTINDAVAIVVFQIMNDDHLFKSAATNGLSRGQLLGKIIAGIIAKLSASMCVGIALAFIYSLTLRWVHMHSHALEILFVVFSCFFTYSLAEVLSSSGIIACLFAGIFMGMYTRPHMSIEGEGLASFFLKSLAMWADMCIFLLVGVDCCLVKDTESWVFVGWTILFLLAGRLVAIVPCGLVANALKSCSTFYSKRQPFMLTPRHLFMMWHAGLRGGIALVLCLEIGDWVDENGGPGTKQVLINTTVIIIVIFLAIFGGSTEMSLRALNIEVGMEADENYLYERSSVKCATYVFNKIDEKVLSPMLIGNHARDVHATSDMNEQEMRIHALGQTYTRGAMARTTVVFGGHDSETFCAETGQTHRRSTFVGMRLRRSANMGQPSPQTPIAQDGRSSWAVRTDPQADLELTTVDRDRGQSMP